MWGDYQLHGWSWMLFGGIHMLFFWLLLGVLIVALVNWLRRSNDNDDDDDNDKQGSQGSRDALDILDQRLARGEIDLDTYRKLKQEVRRR